MYYSNTVLNITLVLTNVQEQHCMYDIGLVLMNLQDSNSVKNRISILGYTSEILVNPHEYILQKYSII